MIIVTGGAGLIGSNLVKQLNSRSISDILIVDNLTNGRKMFNLADLDFKDFIDREDFIARINSSDSFGNIEAIFHLGACSSTTEWNGRYIMQNNFEYSKVLLKWCQNLNIKFIYASSASVYGLASKGFFEERRCEAPINMYAFSKFQFDQYVRSLSAELNSQTVGLRYFNVFGPRETHKGKMASTPFHFNNQLIETGTLNLFEGSHGYENGEQLRDFVYVKDCVDVNLWFLENEQQSGIYNVGTGVARSFNHVANAVVEWHKKKGRSGQIKYIPFPEHLKGSYQSYTKADITRLRSVGYNGSFHTLEEGIFDYLNTINNSVDLN